MKIEMNIMLYLIKNKAQYKLMLYNKNMNLEFHVCPNGKQVEEFKKILKNVQEDENFIYYVSKRNKMNIIKEALIEVKKDD